MKRGFAAACALALAATPLPATAACWNADETSAATVRELQSVLMVAALRCQVVHSGFMDDYNGFLRANRYVIQQMNDRIKAHFIKAMGPVRGLTAYDAFATSLANGHGAEGASPELCSGMGALAREASMMAGSAEGLLLLAARQGVTVALPEGSCTRAPAMALADPAATAIVAAAAAPVASPVTAMAAVTMPVALGAPDPLGAAPAAAVTPAVAVIPAADTVGGGASAFGATPVADVVAPPR